MRWSRLFVPTLKETPVDAAATSHQLLLRAGFIRQLGAGIYSYLPLARRTLLKIEAIVRQEMNRIGAQEFYLPALNPAEIWMESGRWEVMGENMFRLKDRSGRDLCLGMTHEEVFTSIARNELRSYRSLPQIWYQIQTKFRDEPRPKSGLLRVRQFIMKDSYSFDLGSEGLDHSYRLHDQAYRRIFDRCGLRYLVVQAESGPMGGSESEEFMVVSDAGEDFVVHCPQCGYSANLERALSRPSAISDPPQGGLPEQVHTPGQKTIQEVSRFLKIEPARQIKSLVYMWQNRPHLILLRGDHSLSESKLARVLQGEDPHPASAEEIRTVFGADAGSLGPVGIEAVPVLADKALENRRMMVCGANRDDYHLLNVTPGRDFQAEYYDLREVQKGEGCISCGEPLQVQKAIEIGHIFKLGYKYSEAMGATVLNSEGEEIPLMMGSYGIGLERIMVSAVELFHDGAGIIWPASIAPFQVVITLLRVEDREQRQAAEKLYAELTEMGSDVLLDDRDERPGFKFKDAELIGFPVRITVGKKLAQGEVEIFRRRDGSQESVPVEQAVERAAQLLREDAMPFSAT